MFNKYVTTGVGDSSLHIGQKKEKKKKKFKK